MQLVCLGTTGFHPNARRHTASFLLPEVGVVLDAGTGLFRLAEHLATQQIHIFLSHAHLDHVSGLTYLVETFGVDAYDQVTVHGTADKLEAVKRHLYAPHIFPVAPGYQFCPLGETCELPKNSAGDAGTLRTFPLKHPGGSIGMRLQWPGHSLAYVTDTTAMAGADYIEQIRGVDLLVHESNFPAGQDELAELTGHSCLDKVAQVAAAAEVGRLVVTHVDPLLTKDEDFDLSDAHEVFAKTQIAQDLDVLDF
ncbi:MBL fold metallo-hydrolase [Aeoliella sp. ICT_H6.2]|uniref:MBL fold metallo-hydrolase n=1 Tax=Aeoliella straminimaris TaxID=2954799 RepID=A0A9X2FCR1_9BACT|nr:MBL fold metallo-hydrolase [Aeoliella straminimaris]MCO6045773.1 MBL fold metallo-hydrolase [Aeoliella straminimaris]